MTAHAAKHLRGIDVSHHNGKVHWHKVMKSGAAFAFAKATDGTRFSDPQFPANWAGIKAAGLVRGAFHFGRPNHPAVAQARRFYDVVNPDTGDLQLALDLENDGDQDPDDVWAWTKAFLAEIKRLTGRPGIIYTNYFFWKDSVGNPKENLDCPLWLSAYTSHTPRVPHAWTNWTFWQYSEKGSGSLVGNHHAVDEDYYRGTLASLKRLTLP